MTMWAITQWVEDLVQDFRALEVRLRATPRSVLLLRAFGYLWNMVAGIVWVVLLFAPGLGALMLATWLEDRWRAGAESSSDARTAGP
ncbi:MAG: hypothetical protein ACREI3_05885 [Nitrospirales bacterium]